MLQGNSISANGTLVLNSTPPTGVTKVQHIPTFTPGTYTDYRFDIDFIPVSIPTGTTQYQAVELHSIPGSSSFLIFRLQSTSDTRSSTLVYVTPGQSQTLATRAITHNNPLTLRVEQIGSTTNVWLNNTGPDLALMTAWAGTINPGELILETWGSTQAQFDNFYFYCPGDPVPTQIPPTPTPTPTPTITPIPTNSPTPTPGPAACTFQSTWGSQGSLNGQFRNPRQLAIDPVGNLIITDVSNYRVQKFDSAGNFLVAWGSQGTGNGQFSSIDSVATDPSGNIYVSDSSLHTIQKFSPSGTYITQWGSEGSGDGQFIVPHGLAADNNYLYVADAGNRRIQKFDLSGNYLSQWSTLSPTDNIFTMPADVTLDTQGSIYISTIEHANGGDHLVKKFSPSGTVLASWTTGGYAEYGLTVDSAGFVYVADVTSTHDTTRTSSVRKFAPNGTLVATLSSDTVPNLSFRPLDVTINSAGTMYVVDSGNNRIQKFSCSVDSTPTPTGTQLAYPAIKIKFQGVNTQRSDSSVAIFYRQNGQIIHGSGIELTSDANGVFTPKFTNTGGYYPGTYDILLKGPSHLRRAFPNIALNPGQNPLDFTATPLITGDVWGVTSSTPDNTIQLGDLTAMLSAWTSASVPISGSTQIFDLNFDGFLNVQDLSQALNNWTSSIVYGD